MNESVRCSARSSWGIDRAGAGYLLLLDNYFKGAGYSFSRAYVFAQRTPVGAPAALFFLDNSDNIFYQHQDVAGAYRDAQTTAITLFSVYFRHLSQ